jgi:hypothetical protein
MILKVEAHKIFVLCSREVMQQSLGKEKRTLKGGFLCCVFMKGQTLKLGSLRGTLERSSKKNFKS